MLHLIYMLQKLFCITICAYMYYISLEFHAIFVICLVMAHGDRVVECWGFG